MSTLNLDLTTNNVKTISVQLNLGDNGKTILNNPTVIFKSVTVSSGGFPNFNCLANNNVKYLVLSSGGGRIYDNIENALNKPLLNILHVYLGNDPRRCQRINSG